MSLLHFKSGRMILALTGALLAVAGTSAGETTRSVFPSRQPTAHADSEPASAEGTARTEVDRPPRAAAEPNRRPGVVLLTQRDVDRTPPARARRNAPADRRDRPAARKRHIHQALEHLRAAGLHDLAGLVEEEARRRLAAVPDQERPWGPAAREDAHPPHEPMREQVNHLSRMVEELHRALGDLQAHVRESEHLGRAVDEAHRGLEDLRLHVDRHMERGKQIAEEVAQRAEQRLEEFERHWVERSERFQYEVARQLEELSEERDPDRERDED